MTFVVSFVSTTSLEAFYLLEMLVCLCRLTLKVKLLLKRFQTIQTLFINYFILYFGNWMQG